jgi:hypothetical protein
MRKRRPFTPMDDLRLERLRVEYPGTEVSKWRKGAPSGLSAIAKLMDRSRSSIQIRLQFLAAQAEGEKYYHYGDPRRKAGVNQ